MRFLIKNFGSIFISLLLAVLIWVAAVREQNPPIENDYPQSIPIEVIAPPTGLVNTSPAPESVRLRLIAPQSSWANLTPTKIKATLDLSNVHQGVDDVPVQVVVSDPLVEIVDQQPRTASVNIEALRTISMPIEVEVLDSPPLGYTARTPAAEPAEVEITGPVSQVDQVARAVADIFIRNSKETVQATRDVVAKDQNDRTVRGVTISPPTVQLTIPIEQRFGYKDVSVRVNVEGQVAPGYRVSNISVEPPAITVVGNPKGLSQIAGLVETVPINLDQATESIVRTVPLNLPDGVTTVISEQEQNGPGGVQVTVEIAPIEDAVTLERPITQQGIDPDYWWRAAPDRAEVFLSGPLSQLQSLRASDVEVLVDLFDLKPGVHILQPTVFKPDGVRLDAILPDTIEITIGRTVQRPVSQTGLGPQYTWKASPNRVNVMLSADSSANSVNPAEIGVTVDLSELEPGFYQLKPVVTAPAGVVVDSITPDTVNVTINPKAVITATDRVSPVRTPTPRAK
ncbi:MAG: hypothetical protein D6768_12775 [Chloroflexi bacterium]|nr:MAG: hypothetical protein D6768_12775 [Chloroflexota bacterium]